MHLLVKCRSLALAFITLIAVHAVPLPANVPAATSVTQAAPPGPHPAVGSTTSSLTLHNSPQAVQSEEEIPRWISRKPLDQEEVTSTEKNVFSKEQFVIRHFCTDFLMLRIFHSRNYADGDHTR
ncbi:hypothetical protein BT96DRAFT_188404 [Gymnopus androsaceus JB14]|uniref:Uncharacterized protein n=1 Tax=Gymnopus androsaceus JB14 TaxID=1447944 RepID=A0A6A4H9D8_9AGAR|nr:hypothetical protein BT96DRAFT_188404 [Gymnopus androsaceus JB14]